jgi:hypothetical protein
MGNQSKSCAQVTPINFVYALSPCIMQRELRGAFISSQLIPLANKDVEDTWSRHTKIWGPFNAQGNCCFSILEFSLCYIQNYFFSTVSQCQKKAVNVIIKAINNQLFKLCPRMQLTLKKRLNFNHFTWMQYCIQISIRFQLQSFKFQNVLN